MAVLEKTVLIHGRTPEEVFAFCLDGANFPRIFPEPIWPIGNVDPNDLLIKAGREFQFLHWMLYCIPSRWRVRISEVRPNERFVDEMLSGPLRRFRHEHLVKPDAEGTLYTDRVEYEPYGGRLVETLFLNGYMKCIFTARHRNMRKLLEPERLRFSPFRIAELRRFISRHRSGFIRTIICGFHHFVLTCKSIDPNLANKLTPQFTPPTAAKWKGLFSVNMTTDDGIPLNKRGSGVRRLILVSFFKAAAERRLADGNNARSVIYAIEEPETAQHPNNQRILMESFKALAENDGCQVILTTHSPGFASALPVESIRYLLRDNNNKPQIQEGVDVFADVANALGLGLVPDSRVRVLLCVEGPLDIQAFKCLSHALHQTDKSVPDLCTDNRVAFVTLGGSTLEHWVAGNYLRNLGIPEVHIYDGDVAKYQVSVDNVNARTDGSWAVRTTKHEIENYLHPKAIQDGLEVTIEVPDHENDDGHAVPRIVALAMHAKDPKGEPKKDLTVKKLLAKHAFPLMTSGLIEKRDPSGEVKGWLLTLGKML